MYKNLFKIAMSIALVATLLVGCKADDEITITHFKFEGASRVFFEPGQTINVNYNKRRVSKIEIVSSPQGWTVENHDNKYLAITAPMFAGLTSEVIEVKGTSPEGNSNTAKLTVQVVKAESLSDKGTANCYIAPQSGRYSFDATHKGPSSESLTFADAKLLWSAPADAVYSVQTLNGVVSFSTSGVPGNAVIAVCDAKSNVLWSWHIWVADYDPIATAQTYADGSTVMTRNLGAWADVADTDSTSWASSGVYYQWGRKDPFVGGTQYMWTVDQYMYDAEGDWVGVKYAASSSSVGTINYAVAHPMTYIYGVTKSDYDWLYAKRDGSLWNSTTKTLYDPCPAGWIVAPSTTFDFSSEDVVGDYVRGWEVAVGGDAQSYYAAAGRRSFVDGALTNVDVTGYLPVGFNWTATTTEDDAEALEFSPTSIGLSSIYRANACPVRCRKVE